MRLRKPRTLKSFGQQRFSWHLKCARHNPTLNHSSRQWLCPRMCGGGYAPPASSSMKNGLRPGSGSAPLRASRKRVGFHQFYNLTQNQSTLMAHRFLVSQDSPVLYITLVTKDRLPVFRTDQLKAILCRAVDEARKSAGILLFAYVIMIDHIHLLTSRPSTTSDMLRVLKGLTARRVIDYLKVKNYSSSLASSSIRSGSYTHSLWQTEKNVLPIFSENMFLEKLNYIHQNPVRAGLVGRATTIPGPALASGENVHGRMNRCLWTRISFIGDEHALGRSPLRLTESSGAAEPRLTYGGEAEPPIRLLRGFGFRKLDAASCFYYRWNCCRYRSGLWPGLTPTLRSSERHELVGTGTGPSR